MIDRTLRKQAILPLLVLRDLVQSMLLAFFAAAKALLGLGNVHLESSERHKELRVARGATHA